MANTINTDNRRGDATVTVFRNNDAGLFAYRDRYPNGLLFKVRQYCRLYEMQDEPAWRFGQSPPYTDREIREGYKRNVFSGGPASVYARSDQSMTTRKALLGRVLEEISSSKKWMGNPPVLDPETRQALADLGYTVRQDGTIVRGQPRVIQPAPPAPPADPLDSLLDHAEEALRVVRQIIFQGPPGTGKTHAAKRLAARLLGIDGSALDDEEKQTTGHFHSVRFSEGRHGGCWELVQFHPAYAYDDFVRGIQAKTDGGNISYEVVPRVLDRLVKNHRDNATTVLIIDEINRANLAQVLGELIYALEYRGSPVRTPYQIDGTIDDTLAVPRDKFYVIGTMNTADRSIGRIDYAVRRRFAFLQLDPKRKMILQQKNVEEADMRWAASLFDSVGTLFGGGAGEDRGFLAQEFHPDDVQVGHTYFFGRQPDVKLKFAYQVYPLLREYYKDGVLLAQNGRIELSLPSGATIDLVKPERLDHILSKLDQP